MSRMVMPSGPLPARIMIVGEAPGAEEERTGSPFMGASGNELTRMLCEAGINRSECFITNVIRIRPPGNDLSAFIALKKKDITSNHVLLRDKWVLRCVVEGNDLLAKEIRMCNPNVIIALGNCALWALTGKWGITEWRGSTLLSDLARRDSGAPYKVVAAYHPAAVLRQWSWRPTLVHDLKRAKKESAAEVHNASLYSFIIRPSYTDVLDFLDEQWSIVRAVGLFKVDFGRHIPGQPVPGELQGPLHLAVDIETRQHHITCLGIATSASRAICIPFTCEENSEGYWSVDEETQIVFRLYRLLTHPGVGVIGQNWIYDAQHILRWWHFSPRFAFDTMLAQHVLFPGTPKSLDYLASLYCGHYAQWKRDARHLWKNELEEKKDA